MVEGETQLQQALVGLCLCTPSEGEAETRKNCTPSEGGTGMVEGETQLQQALVGVPILRTFGR